MINQALVIGIDKYPAQPLRGCVRDAQEVAKALNYNGDGSMNFDIKYALDVKSKGKLRGMIRALFDCDADICLLYFSGHGYISEFGGYIVTPDGEANDPGISMDEILNYANQSDIKTKIIIFDCCNSGAFGTPSQLQGAALLRKGMTILTSSREKEPAVEKNGHGVFTSLLLDALDGGAADLKGDITPGSIYAHIDMAIGNWGQRPIFRTNVTRFTPVRKVKPLIDMQVLKRVTTHFPDPKYSFPLNPSFTRVKKGAEQEKQQAFADMQALCRVGLLASETDEPNDLHSAAMHSKSCHLTSLGKHYWRLVYENRI